MVTGQAELLDPSVRTGLKLRGIEFEVMQCEPHLADTALFCEHYNVPPEQSCNAIIVVGKADPPKYACALVLANAKLDVNKKVSQLLGIKRCSFASAEQTLELTGMQIGGVTPFGLPDIPIYVDAEVMTKPTIVLGGGNRMSKVAIKPEELRKLPGVVVVEGLGIPR